MGLYGQGKATAWERLDVTAGLRYDFEHQHGDLFSNSGGPRSLAAGQDFSEVSPQASLGYHLDHDNLVYFSVARGYRAGGFNNVPASLKQTYGTEHDWNYELGYKSKWLDGKVETKLALFYIDWSSLQLNQFIPLPSGAYYTPVINANSATSKGVELEAKYRPVAGWDLFGSLGYTDATFGNGNSVYGVKVDGNPLPNTPSFTGQAGTQVSWAPCKAATLYARAEVDVTGNFQYGPTKSLGQETFALANFRAGLRGKNWFAEGWVNNAFDTHYIPIAFHLGASAQSGWAGESGLPLTFGLRAGLKF